MNPGDQFKRAAIWHLTRNVTRGMPWWLSIIALIVIILLGDK